MNSNKLNIIIEVDDNGTPVIRKLGKEMETSSRKGDEGFKRTNRTLGDFNTKVDKGSTLVKGLGTALAGYLTARAAGEVLMLADNYSLLNSRLRLVTDSAAELEMVQGELYRISQDTGTLYATNAPSYATLAMSLKEIGASSREMLGITEMVNKSLVVSGATAEETSSFMLQFKQALGSGVLQGEEFRAMMEANSYFGAQLAKALDTDIAGLRKMSAEGELTTDLLRKSFPAMAEEINTAFDTMPVTIGRAFNRIKNSLGKTVEMINEGTGTTSNMAEAMVKLADKIDDLRSNEDFQAFVESMAEKLPDLAENIDVLATASAHLWTVFKEGTGTIKQIDQSMVSFFDTVIPGTEAFLARMNKTAAEAFNPMAVVRKYNDSMDAIQVLFDSVGELNDSSQGFQDFFGSGKTTEDPFSAPAKSANQLAAEMEALASKQEGYTEAVEGTIDALNKQGDAHIKLSDKQLKAAEKIIQSEQKAADEAAQAKKEMYEEAGIGAEAYYSEEATALLEKAKLWEKNGADTLAVEEWLYEQLGQLSSKAMDEGEVMASMAMDNLQAQGLTALDEMMGATQEGIDQLAQYGLQLDTLDGTEFTVYASLDGSGVDSTIDRLIGRFQALAGAATSASSSAGGERGTSSDPETQAWLDNQQSSGNSTSHPNGTSRDAGIQAWLDSQSNGGSTTNTTNININQQLSRSDVSAILAEKSRQEARS
jgi:tape measure domain-containing protein